MLDRKSLMGKAARLPLRLIPRNTVLPILSGPAMGARWVVGSATNGAWLGTYESDKARRFAASIKPGDVVYDIGAHAGFYTIIAARRGAKVFAFEPWLANYLALNAHIKINHLSTVTALNCAVADTSGEKRFQLGTASQQGRIDARGSLVVDSICIDDALADGALSPPNVIKMDIEGGEYNALLGMKKTLSAHRPTMLLATHSDTLNESCFALLRECGLAIRPIDGLPIERTREVLVIPR